MAAGGKRPEASKDRQPNSPAAGPLSALCLLNPPIAKVVCVPKSDVVFHVNLEDLGISASQIMSNPVFRSPHFADFLGELLVRRNIELFTPLLLAKHARYDEACKTCRHEQFGMSVTTRQVRFAFHISLLHGIMNEHLTELVGEVTPPPGSRKKKPQNTADPRILQKYIKAPLGQGSKITVSIDRWRASKNLWRELNKCVRYALDQIGVRNIDMRLDEDQKGYKVSLSRRFP